MTDFQVQLSAHGGIVLGEKIVCDGFFADVKTRVQTHVHFDHMSDFERSKGYHSIIMSEPTKELLITELNADLPYRSNLISIPMGQLYPTDGIQIELLSSGHMLGAVQVGITMEDGSKLAYSGDFNWPVDDVIQTNVLVVDSTYGSPDRARKYTQDEVDSRLMELVAQQLLHGAVHVKAHRGTLQRALELIDAATTAPIIAADRLCQEIEIYRKFGYNIRPILNIASVEAEQSMADGQYVRLYGLGEADLFGLEDGTAINLSAFMASTSDPVLEYTPTSFRVAMTCHADFDGTLSYIEATGADYVITDNRRSHGVELANAIRSQLGIDASPSQIRPSRYWGH